MKIHPTFGQIFVTTAARGDIHGLGISLTDEDTKLKPLKDIPDTFFLYPLNKPEKKGVVVGWNTSKYENDQIEKGNLASFYSSQNPQKPTGKQSLVYEDINMEGEWGEERHRFVPFRHEKLITDKKILNPLMDQLTKRAIFANKTIKRALIQKNGLDPSYDPKKHVEPVANEMAHYPNVSFYELTDFREKFYPQDFDGLKNLIGRLKTALKSMK